MRLKGIFLLITLGLFLSCSASKFGWVAEDQDNHRSGRIKMKEDFDPLTLQDDDIVIESQQYEKAENAEERTHQPVVMEDKKPAEKPIEVQGYRVQIMIGKDEEKIQEEKKKVIFKFHYPVYVEFETPYYKIRIGDFTDQDEAVRVREEAKRKGYPDAFIARCMVKSSGSQQ